MGGVALLRLVAGNLNYSSWSMRPWLALTHAGAPFAVHDVRLKTAPDWQARILAFSGAGKVPVLVDNALTLHESLAICEYVAELYPEAALWPDDRQLRARGRAISCEMLSSFSALRTAMPCNLRGRSVHTPQSPAIERDIARVLEIWEASLSSSGGPFLLGEFSIADCMYFPVALRFRTYGVKLTEAAERYAASLFSSRPGRELERVAAGTEPIAEYDAALAAPVG